MHLLKLIGAFILLGAALMLLSNVYKMLWIASIVGDVNSGASRTIAMDLAGVSVSEQLMANDVNTQLGLLLVPVAGIMFWAAILVLGAVIYKTGGIILPIEEEIKGVPHKKKKK